VIGSLFDLIKRFLAVCFSFFLLLWGKIDFLHFLFSLQFVDVVRVSVVYISLIQVMGVCVCANEFVARFRHEKRMKKKRNKETVCVVVVLVNKMFFLFWTHWLVSKISRFLLFCHGKLCGSELQLIMSLVIASLIAFLVGGNIYTYMHACIRTHIFSMFSVICLVEVSAI